MNVPICRGTTIPVNGHIGEWAYRYASIPICYLPKFEFLMICSISSFISFVMLFCVLGWKARNLLAALWNLSGCKKEGFVYPKIRKQSQWQSQLQ